MKVFVVLFLIQIFGWVFAGYLPSNCDVLARTEQGIVCGKTRYAANGDVHASFRGIRYAKAPFGELRFAEPQIPEPFDDIFDASEHGPVCPQYDIIYTPLTRPTGTSEDCLRMNIHVPLTSLPDFDNGNRTTLLPVFIFLHGGSFSFGSGDTDIHGPEYMMSGKGIIFITINYRVAAFGFLSLFSKEIPGNAGLRDVVFALKWIRSNIAYFGGDPGEVTLGGQSAGGAIAHILSISPVVLEEKLFKRCIAMSGNALAGFFSYSKAYARFISTGFLLAAGINILQSPEGIHRDLIRAPLDSLIQANKVMLDLLGLISFAPVVEEPAPGFTMIIPKDPEILVTEGYGNEIKLWLNFCNNEAQSLRNRLAAVNLEIKLNFVPSYTVPTNILWSSNLLKIPLMTKLMKNEYFNNSLITMDKFLNAATDGFYKYSVLRLAEKRIKSRAESTFVSEFSLGSSDSPVKYATSSNWSGAAHCDDLAYFLRINAYSGPQTRNELALDTTDSRMKNWMTDFITQFVKTGSPVTLSHESYWPPATSGQKLHYQVILVPQTYNFTPVSPYLEDKKRFYDRFNKIGRGL